MGISVKSNIDEIVKHLENLASNAEKLNGTHNVSFKEMFTDEFISNHSNFNSFEELFNASGFDWNSAEKFKAIPDDKWEHFITTHTTFSSWAEMQEQAVSLWGRKQIGF